MSDSDPQPANPGEPATAVEQAGQRPAGGLKLRRGRFTAVDFDAAAVRIAQVLTTASGPKAVKLVRVPIPPDVDVSDPEVLGRFVGRELRRQRAGKRVLFQVPRSQAVLKPLSLPPVEDENELAGMVRFQAEQDLPLMEESTVLDFAVEHHFDAEARVDAGGGTSVLVAATQGPVVAFYQALAKAAGVRPLRLGLRPYANLCGVMACGALPAGQTVALVHVTAGETEIDVFRDESVVFSRSARWKRSVLAAETPDESGSEPSGHTAQTATSVVAEAVRTLNSFQAVHRTHLVDHVLVAGDTGLEAAVAAGLTHRLNLPCVKLEPPEALQRGVGGKGSEDASPDASGFVAAVGLAVGQGRRHAPPFDFFQPKKPRPARDPMRLVKLVATVILGSGVAIGAAAGYLHRQEAHRTFLRVAAEQSDLNREIRFGKADVRRAEAIRRWQSRSRDWLPHLTQLTALLPGAKSVYVTSLRGTAETGLTLGLRAKDHDAITELNRRLAAAGYEFRPGPVSTTNDPFDYPLSTTLRIEVPQGMEVDLEDLPDVTRPKDDASAELIAKRR